MDGWKDGWMEGWVDGFSKTSISKQTNLQLYMLEHIGSHREIYMLKSKTKPVNLYVVYGWMVSKTSVLKHYFTALHARTH